MSSNRRRRPQAYKGKSFGPEVTYHDPAAPKVKTQRAPRRQATRRDERAAAIREAR